MIFNSTALDGTKEFRNFFFSALAVQRLSDLICLEHQLSVIEKKPYRERQKRVLYPPKESNRDRLCGIIDTILAEKPKDFEVFLQKLEQQGYEAKRGKHTAVKGKGQKRFIRFRTLGTEYSEEEIKAVLEDKGETPAVPEKAAQRTALPVAGGYSGKMAEGKSVGYKRWATKFNLKEMSKTLLFLQEQKISSAEELRERAAAATERYHAMGDSIKAAETRLAEIAVLKTHIINYAKTRPVYDAYRKSGYSKKFLEAHRRRSPCTRRRRLPLTRQDCKAAQGQGVGCGVCRAADQEESSLPGLPQGTERNARTGSGTEKRGTIFCGGKASTGERAGSIKADCRELTVSGRFPAIFFVDSIFNGIVYLFGLCMLVQPTGIL